MHLGQDLKAAIDRCITESPRRIDGTDRHVAEHSQAWPRPGPLHIEIVLNAPLIDTLQG